MKLSSRFLLDSLFVVAGAFLAVASLSRAAMPAELPREMEGLDRGLGVRAGGLPGLRGCWISGYVSRVRERPRALQLVDLPGRGARRSAPSLPTCWSSISRRW